jgi:hypothetical protein
MKIAVTVGDFMPRTFDNFKKYFMDPLNAQGHQIDLFAFTWEITGTPVPVTEIQHEYYDYKLSDGTMWTVSRELLKMDDVNPAVSNLNFKSTVYITNEYKKAAEFCKNPHKVRWLGASESYRLITNPESYDLIVNTGLDDNLFSETFQVDEDMITVGDETFKFDSNIDPKLVEVWPEFCPSELSVVMPFRGFAIGNPKSMKVYFRIWEKIDDLLECVRYDGIPIIHLLANDVKVHLSESMYSV